MLAKLERSGRNHLYDSASPGTRAFRRTLLRVLGLVAAFFGILLSRALDRPQLDGAASVLIGLILIVVALLLVEESKALLVGEGADKRTLCSIMHLAESDPGVERAGYPLTMYFGPHNVLLTRNI